MKKQVNFSISKTEDNKHRFICDDIVIITDHYTIADDTHYITNPDTATALLKCCEKKYSVDNIAGFTSIEEWYIEELLPKRQMLNALLKPGANIEVPLTTRTEPA